MKSIRIALFTAALMATPALTNAAEITEANQSAPAVETANARLNLNTATAEQLATLPGIGPSKAQAIIAFRKQQGRFDYAEDLTMVKGIGERIYAKLADKVVVK